MASTTNKKQTTPLDLKYEIIKEESNWAGVNFLYHPDFRDYAKQREKMPFEYEEFYNDPKKKKEREEDEKKFALYHRQEPLGEVLKLYPEKKDIWEAIDPNTKISMGEFKARDEFFRKQGPSTAAVREMLKKSLEAKNSNNYLPGSSSLLKEGPEFIRPTTYTRISSEYGWRTHPVRGGRHLHGGTERHTCSCRA